MHGWFHWARDMRSVGEPYAGMILSKKRPSLEKPRNQAFKQQNGLCFYCHKPMWVSDIDAFARQYGISLNQAQYLKCTGEHLVAHNEGGSGKLKNIVAACRFCNEKRHNRKNPPDPQAYSALVERRLQKGGWNSHLLDLERQSENRLPVWSRTSAG